MKHTCAGFSLIELLTAMAISSVLILAIGSAITLAARALPAEDDPHLALLHGGGAVDTMQEDLEAAVHITERTATSVTLALPDRDGDGRPEVVRYAWSGTGGDPLTRRLNGGAVVPLLGDVHDLDLSFDLKTSTETYPGPHVTTSESILVATDVRASTPAGWSCAAIASTSAAL